MRDKSGTIQLVFGEEKFTAPLESCLGIEGTVLARPVDMANSKLTTGEVEVHVDKINCLNAAMSQLPFYIKPYNTAKESLRLKHRYLDLRHPWLQNNLKIRSDLMLKMRQFLQDEGFLDIETPTLFRRTPGGAQEFVVPSHVEDHFYSLVQSPQQFKQLLMVGGVEKYYQIARYYYLHTAIRNDETKILAFHRCYRDEGSRPDRQPEFTQVDIELSFTTAAQIQCLIETLLKEVWPSSTCLDRHSPFPKLTYQECMSKYGSDKPDLRITNEIQDLQDNIKMIAFKNDEIQKLSKTAAKKMAKEHATMSKNCQIAVKNMNMVMK